VAVLAPLGEPEILWRLLTGPYAEVIRQMGLPDSGLAHVNHAIRWIRDNYAALMRIADLAPLTVPVGVPPAFPRQHGDAATGRYPPQLPAGFSPGP